MSQDQDYFESPFFMVILILGTLVVLPFLAVARLVRWSLRLVMKETV